MVPTRRPSPNTSILAPTRCGVEPVVETMVTSAAGSPRSSASATAAKTSWFICSDYTGLEGVEGLEGQEGQEGREAVLTLQPLPPFQPIPPFLPLSELMHQTLFHGLSPGHERLGNCRGAVGGGQLPARRADAGKGDALNRKSTR